MIRRAFIALFAKVGLDDKPNRCLPGCPISGCTGRTYIIGEAVDIPGSWDCYCDKCGVRFIHNSYLHCPPGYKTR